MTNAERRARFSKMNSNTLLKAISKGNLTKNDATVAAKILEKRFPTPKK
jgi:hypothetical protein